MCVCGRGLDAHAEGCAYVRRTQDYLHRFVLDTETIKVSSKSAPVGMPSAPFNAAAFQRRLNRSSDKIAQVKRSTLLLASKDISVLWNAPPVLFERLTQDGQDGQGRSTMS